VAGLSLSAIDNPTRRRTFALYLLARVFQCTYNFAKMKGKWHFWGSHWQHGDTLLFALASAQVSSTQISSNEFNKGSQNPKLELSASSRALPSGFYSFESRGDTLYFRL
jgi:hypothetical protein